MVHKELLPGTLILADAMPCTSSASHVHALGPPQVPTYLPLGCNLSILAGTNNGGNAHDA